MFKTMSAIVGGLLLLFPTIANADVVSKKTTVTLHEPVIVAGVETVTLQPGVYVIKLMSHPTNRNIVLFYNQKQDHLFATAMAINNYRLNPTPKTVFTYWETPRGNPPALKAWFPPGERWGQEFVYPKGLAVKIAKETGAKVLTAPATKAEELVTAPITEIEATGKEVPLEEAYVAPPPETTAEVVPAPAPELIPVPLPATGSPLFDIGLMGLVMAAAGAALRRLS